MNTGIKNIAIGCMEIFRAILDAILSLRLSKIEDLHKKQTAIIEAGDKIEFNFKKDGVPKTVVGLSSNSEMSPLNGREVIFDLNDILCLYDHLEDFIGKCSEYIELVNDVYKRRKNRNKWMSSIIPYKKRIECFCRNFDDTEIEYISIIGYPRESISTDEYPSEVKIARKKMLSLIGKIGIEG